jgi:hypothetical protein
MQELCIEPRFHETVVKVFLHIDRKGTLFGYVPDGEI